MNAADTLHYHGFQDSELSLLKAARSQLTLRAASPSLIEVVGGTIVPLRYRGRTSCGVYDGNDNPVPLSARFRGTEPVEGTLTPEQLRPVASSTRHAFFLGSGEKHYGHFLLEVLCRAWAWAWSEGNELGVPVLQSEVPAFARDIYSLIPGVADKIEIVRRPTRFRSIRVPGASFIIRREAYHAFKDLCERMAQRAISGSIPPSDRPVYLSRSGLDHSRRTIIGELRLERHLEEQGFLIVKPETLSIMDQMALVNRHRWIVSPTGSATHTRLFSCISTNFVTITPAFFNQNHVLCDLLCDGRAHYVRALHRPNIGTDLPLENVEPLLVDHGAVLGTLKELGLIRGSVNIRDSESELNEYRTRWIEAARWLAKARPSEARRIRAAILEVRKSHGKGGHLWPQRSWLALRDRISVIRKR